MLQKSLLLLSPLLTYAVPPKPLTDRRIIILGEECPAITGTTKFNADQYLGTWFNMANAPFIWQPTANTCGTAQYYTPPANTRYDIQVVNTELSARTNELFSTTGKATIQKDQPGTINVAFGPIQPKQGMNNYIILDTDNLNYSWVWSCQNYCDDEGNCDGDQPVLWILNRQRTGDSANVWAQIDAALQIVQNAGYSAEAVSQIKQRMHVTDQSSQTCDAYYAENADKRP